MSITYDYIVDPVNGDDNNNGQTEGTAFETIRRAGLELQSIAVNGVVGDRVIIGLRNGLYHEHLHTTGGSGSGGTGTTFIVDGTEQSPIWIRPYGSENPVIEPAGAGWVLAIQGLYYEIGAMESWLEIRNGGNVNLSRGGINIQRSAITDKQARGCIVRKVHAHHNRQTGIQTHGPAHDIIFEYNYSHDNYDILLGGNNADGIKSARTSNIIVRHNVLFRNADDGLDMIHTGIDSAGGGIVHNNISLWNGYYDAEYWNAGTSRKVRSEEGNGYGFKYGGAEFSDNPMTFYRNIAFENRWGYVHFVPHTRLWNNVSAKHPSSGFRGVGQTTLEYRNNIAYEDSVSLVDEGGSISNPGQYPSDEYNSWTNRSQESSKNNLGVTPIASHFKEVDIPASILSKLNHSYDGSNSPPVVTVDEFDTEDFFHLDENYTGS